MGVALLVVVWLAAGAAPAHAAFPGRNGRIAFAGTEPFSEHIYTVRPDGKRLTAILDDASDPAWSPDGTQLAYDAGWPDNQGIFISDAVGHHAVQVTHHPYPSFDQAPAWSRDGARLALIRCQDVSVCALVVIDADGSNAHRLTPWSDIWHDQPSWSADDRTLVFEQGYAIYSIHTDGTGLTELTFPGSNNKDLSPDYSPDGSQIVWSRSNLSGVGGELWVMNADGTGQTQITQTSTDEQLPSWSPDGRQIAFVCGHRGGGVPCAMWSDGTHERALAGAPINENESPPGPDWQPVP